MLQSRPENGFDLLHGHIPILGDVAYVEPAAEESRHLQQPERLRSRRSDQHILAVALKELLKKVVGCLLGKVAQILRHEFDHVVCILHCLDPGQVPLPMPFVIVELLRTRAHKHTDSLSERHRDESRM